MRIKLELFRKAQGDGSAFDVLKTGNWTIEFEEGVQPTWIGGPPKQSR